MIDYPVIPNWNEKHLENFQNIEARFSQLISDCEEGIGYISMLLDGDLYPFTFYKNVFELALSQLKGGLDNVQRRTKKSEDEQILNEDD